MKLNFHNMDKRLILGIPLSFIAGIIFFLLMSTDILKEVEQYGKKQLNDYLYFHLRRYELYIESKHFHIVPEGSSRAHIEQGPSFGILASMLINGAVNFIFQPLFVSVFMPQVLLNFFLLPFFIYGCVKYFTKVPFLIILFFMTATYAIFYAVIVEPLIRYRLSCEMLYILIGVAGFINLITKRS